MLCLLCRPSDRAAGEEELIIIEKHCGDNNIVKPIPPVYFILAGEGGGEAGRKVRKESAVCWILDNGSAPYTLHSNWFPSKQFASVRRPV